jgi:2-polyprenyl-3-methyl-5-hydroxy-6-metoxy-1,4-benzoquinol methylase
VLEHVVDPVSILRLCGQWLSGSGRILAAVPNKDSVHRQAAVEMGLLSKLDDFSEKDKRHGHRRIFGRDSFLKCFVDAGFKITESGGYWLKPFSDSQIEHYYTDKMIDAFLKLGEQYPNIAGEIYAVAESNERH